MNTDERGLRIGGAAVRAAELPKDFPQGAIKTPAALRLSAYGWFRISYPAPAGNAGFRKLNPAYGSLRSPPEGAGGT